LEADISRAQITDFSTATPDQVGVGSVVKVEDSEGKEQTYTILGAWDGDPDNHIISYKTPFGAALLTHRVGDTITTRIGDTETTVTLKEIRRYLDESAK